MISLALTGGIACGKSELGRLLGRLGADVVDADAVVRRMHLPGGEGAKIVAAMFGSGYLLKDGATDRAKLAQLVFADRDARRKLEEEFHPIVRKWLIDWKSGAASPSAIRVAQIPLLFESDWSRDWDFTATVEVSSMEARLARLAARGLSRADAEARIAAQLPASVRASKADFVVRNDGDVAQLGVIAEILFDSLKEKTR